MSKRGARRKVSAIRRHPVLAALSGMTALALLWVSGSIGMTLAAPGTDTTAARLAEWARVHDLGWAVTAAEKVVYSANKPKEGGALAGGIPELAEPSQPAGQSGKSKSLLDNLVPLRAQVQPALASEGSWQVLYRVRSEPAADVAFVRPDPVHTSYLTGVVVMDQNLSRFQLHPGTQVPGRDVGVANTVTASERKTLLATFNSGFQMQDCNGGYWQNGVTVAPLRQGAASLVVYSNGRIGVEAWPGGTPGQDIVAVRQNLVPIIDHGVVSPLVHDETTSAWGKTVGNKAYVWRSAIGVRADGTVVFVIGPALNIESLAAILQSAGAVDAMELDINQDWTSFISYDTAGTNPHKLTRDEVPDAGRYLVTSTRDFVSVTSR